MLADDLETWKRIMRGDASAFEEFYAANQPRLVGFLRQLVGSLQGAEDVAQDTFIQIWRRPDGFRPERGTLRAYLYGIGRRQAAEWWRKHMPRESEIEAPAKDGGAQDRVMMSDAFRHLSTEQRTLLWLREVEGHSYAELAAVLEVPVGTVRSRLFTAREALRKVWQSTR